MNVRNFMRAGLSIGLLCLSVLASHAQKPRWVGNTPKELNYTYKFIEIVSTGSSIESARMDAKDRLTEDTQLQEGVRFYRKERENIERQKQRSTGKGLSVSEKSNLVVDLVVDGDPVFLQAVRVDEYIEQTSTGVKLHSLFMVGLCENPVFDRTYITTRYGAAPVLMSVIPGMGQWYKGSKVKASCLFGAEALAVAGIIFCDNEKATYRKKMKEQPRFAKEYNSKADNWETGRNICIGAAAGIWIYNIVDAAVAKGVRRVKVSRADGGELSVVPFAVPDMAGVSIAYRF